MMTRDQAQALIKSVLARSTADEARVTVRAEASGHLRFARNTVSTSAATTGQTVTVESCFGKRTGSVRVNQLDEATLADAVKRAEEIARLAPEDPEHMPVLPAQEYLATEAFDEATAAGGPEALATAAGGAMRAAAGHDLVAAGFTQAGSAVEATGNSAGLFGFHRDTACSFSTTMRTRDATGSGWAGRASRRWSDLGADAAAAVAAQKAVASRPARPLPAGKYTAILEPACVASMVQILVGSMDRRRADEGRSYFAAPQQKKKGASAGGTRLGEKLFDPRVDIRSDPADRRVASRPWGGDGLPHRPRAWIERGRVATLSCDRYWASQKKVEPVPRAPNFIMAGGKGTLEELIKGTKKGVLVTSLWYIRSVDPQTLLYTGLTRDGVFWVENGEIAYPVNNFRWNESPVAVLKKIEAMSAAEPIPSRGDENATSIIPALRVSDFTFSSISDAV
jgi:predicted Zn-dependent protease